MDRLSERTRRLRLSRWLLLVFLFWRPEAEALGAPTSSSLAMSSAPECTQCHLVWLDDFAGAAADLLVPYQREAGFESGREGAESTDLMCYSCHDGYVEDSRARIRLGYQHPMAGISRLRTPRRPALPLLREEEVYCGTCHTPHGPGHGLESAAGKAGAYATSIVLENNAFLRLAQRPGPAVLCSQCHEYTTSTATLGGNHSIGPNGQNGFVLPPELLRLHALPNSEKGGIGCQSCHNLHGATNPLLVLLGGTDGTSPGLCAVCHKADLSKTGLGRYSHPVGVSPVPTRGPDVRPIAKAALAGFEPAFSNGEKIPVSAAGQMTCLSCHDIHESRVAEKLLRQSSREGDLCGACHLGVAVFLKGNEHDLRVSAPTSQNVLNQTPEQSGLCGPCHVVHKGRALGLWARTPRGGEHVLDRLCLSCHVGGGVARSRLRVLMSHSTRIDKSLIRLRVEGADPSFAIPIYDDDGRPAEQGLVTCLTCHDPHKWQPEEIPPAEYPPVGTGTAMDSFLRTRSQDQLCKHCHGVRALWRYQYFHSVLRYEK
jgi:predicted CXXCH cytochrome family protein